MNELQRMAAEAPNGLVQIIAGPGTGKTVTMVGRVLEFLERGVQPEKLVAMTFTRAAARELRERVRKSAGDKADGIRIGTFHSVALYYLRRYGEFQRRNIKLLSDSDKISLCKEIEPKMSAREVLKLIRSPDNPEAQQLRHRFKERQHALNFYDFDELLEVFDDFLAKHHETTVDKHIDAVLVDEFQDTNSIQLKIAMRMAGKGNLTVVGDPNQSIYAFRGALPEIFEKMKTYGDVKEMALEVNYRSTQPILDLAHGVLPEKSVKLKSFEGNGDIPVQIAHLDREQSEATLVVDQIEQLLDAGVKAEDICVLSASTRNFVSFESVFMARKIGIRVVGGRQLLRSGPITMFIDYVRVALDHNDKLAIGRTINSPPRRLGPKSLQALELSIESLSRSSKPAVRDYITNVNEVERVLGDGKKEDLCAAIKYIGETLFPEVDYKPLLIAADMFKEEYDAVKHDELSFARYFASMWALNPEGEEESNESKITCSTIHSAKGLEWPVVFLLGVNRSWYRPSGAEETGEGRRLLFVALTRAKRYLAISLVPFEDYSILNLDPGREKSRGFAPIEERAVRTLQTCLDYPIKVPVRREQDSVEKGSNCWQTPIKLEGAFKSPLLSQPSQNTERPLSPMEKPPAKDKQVLIKKEQVLIKGEFRSPSKKKARTGPRIKEEYPMPSGFQTGLEAYAQEKAKARLGHKTK